MAIKKKSGGGGGANWMDTYGDMVTLLLCFFVLLYSMSTVSEDKWKAIVQSFNPAGIIAQLEELQGGSGPSADENQGGGVFDNPNATDEKDEQQKIEDTLKEMAEAIKQMAADEELGDAIEVKLEGGEIYVKFSDTVFFGGDSSDLRPQGKEVLSKVCQVLEEGKKAIFEIRIQGHTAQADPNKPNKVAGDRRLASRRAAEVVIFIQENTTIHPARLIDEGYGQWRPIGDNKSEAGRAPNRRVEMIISGVDLKNTALNEAMESFISLDGGEP